MKQFRVINATNFCNVSCCLSIYFISLFLFGFCFINCSIRSRVDEVCRFIFLKYRIQNFYATTNITLIKNCYYFGWAFNQNQFYYFTVKNFRDAIKTTNPNTIAITMNRYKGNLKNYAELKSYILDIANSTEFSSK